VIAPVDAGVAATGERALVWQRGPGLRRPRLSPLWLLVAPIVLLVAALLTMVIWLSFLQGLPGTPTAHVTLLNYVSLYQDSFVLGVLLNTLGFAGVSVLVALIFGVGLAWLVERTDLPGKPFIYTATSLGLLLPGFLSAMGWLFLLHPRIGAINQWAMRLTGRTEPVLEITNVVGMGWVEGLSLAPLVFALTAASLRAMDPALEEAAIIHGAHFGQAMRRVFLPLVFPSVLASALYAFTIAFASFDVPAIIGLSNRVFTFSTFVFSKSVGTGGLPEYGSTAAMSVLMVLLALASSVWYGRVIRAANRYQVITGKAYRPRLLALGGWSVCAWAFVAVFFLCGQVLPLGLLVWTSGQPFFQPPSLEALRGASLRNFQDIPVDLLVRGGTNTLILMLLVPSITLLAAFGFSWLVVRSRSRLRYAVDFFAFLPHAVPSIIFAVGAAFVALFVLRDLPLYGSLALIGIVYVVIRLSFATRLLNSALMQVHRELEEAAAISGASAVVTARRVLMPLVMPALLNGWLWMALLTYRELTVASVLYSPGNITLPLVVWNYWLNGQFGVASAISLVLLGLLTPLVLLYWLISRGATGGQLPRAARGPQRGATL
jgi:iron(III) transport system permease protein